MKQEIIPTYDLRTMIENHQMLMVKQAQMIQKEDKFYDYVNCLWELLNSLLMVPIMQYEI